MKVLILSLLFISSLGQRHNRDDEDTAVEDAKDTADSGLELVDMNDDEDEDEEYDIEDYYEDYEGSGGIFDNLLGIGRNVLNVGKNLFGGSDEDDFDEYEGSAVVDQWWKSWSQNYDEDLYTDTDESEHVTRYPLPNLNENGHIDMSEFGFRDTLDEYFDIFVIILSASILLLLACAAYGRIRNIRYLKKQYGDNKPGLEEESGALLSKPSD